ncbi:DUF1282 domain-containing protein [Thauera aromatica]|uniref:YIP1 family protein n=1 Tax=Thauera aromatica TaxID=59405 RepID=UPI001FFDD8D3|nr:YIP1 family protein [Thauera aromatica]MCK2086970.1 DUF1282 domain-containing protein [Thauera aromatica]
MMKFLHLPPMMWSSSAAWDEIARARPSTISMIFGLILPLSALPPRMLIHAADHIGAHYFPDVSADSWRLAALLFFVAELVSLLLITWLIREVSKTRKGSADIHDAFTVAVVAALPLWLSSLVLLQHGIVPVIAIPLLALAASVALIRYGVENLLHVREPIDAFELAVIVTNSGVFAWIVLVGIALAPVLAA